ncbi:UNVERIFIED_CONTAM: hypothetical protein Sangu_2646800 [Sesamum angustifolium]|uniref:Retrotransposon gag domain-containing protein n=1 Tax=Sesamum angustifolium TaxID=2727405 RepID=A0AAW2J3L7_9LAMI
MAESSNAAETRQTTTILERLQLHGSDHPGMVLRALRAKMKLGFIDGTSIKPSANDPHFEQWIRVDNMVTTWILNFISKGIVEAFMYTKSSRNLWLDLEQRYSECNRPQLYQLQREICSQTQGNASLSLYFRNRKKLWDKIAELKPTPQCTCNGCTCGASKAVSDSTAFTQPMQFLMGLNDDFYSVRHQLLVMDPVPSINKAYAMVQSVEKQKQVHMDLFENTETTVLQVKGGMRYEKKKFNVDSELNIVHIVTRQGHSKDTCFKLHGTPDCYKEFVDKKRRNAGPTRGFTVETTTKKGAQIQPDTKEELLHELIRLMKHSMQPDQV